MECEKCNGTGRVQNPPDPPHPPTYKRCSCMLKQDILKNVERGMKGLSKFPKVENSPLMEVVDKNVVVTAGREFLPHLRHVAVRMPPSWNFKITSDAELVTAWLGSIALKGRDILDADAYMVSTKYVTITDLVTPPDLLIIKMGVKTARNQAASEVLAEAINLRTHPTINRPTWIWEEPHHPLNSGHMFWSDQLGFRLAEEFSRVKDLADPGGVKKPGAVKKFGIKGSPIKKSRKTLRGGRE